MIIKFEARELDHLVAIVKTLEGMAVGYTIERVAPKYPDSARKGITVDREYRLTKWYVSAVIKDEEAHVHVEE
ncbi:hypothetical protein ABND12_18055 [Paenibacillus larvae]